jgi:hypothetical protein
MITRSRPISRPTAWLAWMACLGAAGSLAAATEGTVSLSCSTVSAGGKFSPRHVLAVWVADGNTNFIKTLCRYGTKRTKYLNAWRIARQNEPTVDGITGATRPAHSELAITWDCRDSDKKLVPDGPYLLFVELADSHDHSPKAVFAVEKGPTSQTKTFADEEFLKKIRVSFQPQEF